MGIKSISGIGCYVQDIGKTAEFYTSLGFRLGKQDDKSVTVYLNWFWMEFVAIGNEEKAEFQKEATAENKGAGMYINISVDDVDEFYQTILAKDLHPSSEPRDWSWGRREFVLRDPDGYKLVFFTKK